MMTVGIDEVGRGCLAGPLVAGAVLLPAGYLHEAVWKLGDSKQLTARQRDVADLAIRQLALAYGVGWVSPREVDRYGITKSVRLAMRRAVRGVTVPYDEIVIDGSIDYLRLPQSRSVIKADVTVPAVSAASIIAKVARDSYMQALAQRPRYMAYGFERHVGYGTTQHLAALARYGVTPQHRRSFAPVAQLIKVTE